MKKLLLVCVVLISFTTVQSKEISNRQVIRIMDLYSDFKETSSGQRKADIMNTISYELKNVDENKFFEKELLNFIKHCKQGF